MIDDIGRCMHFWPVLAGEYEINKAYHDLQDLIERTHTDNMEILIELIPQGIIRSLSLMVGPLIVPPTNWYAVNLSQNIFI